MTSPLFVSNTVFCSYEYQNEEILSTINTVEYKFDSAISLTFYLDRPKYALTEYILLCF